MPHAIWICAVVLPIVGSCLIFVGSRLLLGRVPQGGPTNGVRADIHLVRAAYAEIVVGLTILSLWSLGVAGVGVALALHTIFHTK
jgi:hypothetical protein